MTDIATGVPAVDPAAVQPITPAAPAPLPQDIGTPPPSPAPEVIGEALPAAAPEGDADGSRFDYRETGDPALDTALAYIGDRGLGPDHPAVIDAVDGKFERLEAVLEALGDKAPGWQRIVALAKDAHLRSADKQAKTQTSITSAVHEAAGSAENWDAIKAWAGQNADPAEKAEINAMLTAGPLQARAAALLLQGLYNGAGGTTVNPDQVVVPNAGGAPNANSGALSRHEYAEAVRALRTQLGSRMDDSQEYAALRARARFN